MANGKILCAPKNAHRGIPKEKPIISISGITEQNVARDQKWLGTSLGVNAIPAATATAACEIAEGTINFLYRFA
jgi:hypothetical protein